ncbi:MULTISPECIES: amidohydrolase family protein [unclassified Pseudomonas]|uniref:amidohydrolase family protein n=1 Tax=unclassified Pseudomonas TaxID=196821 RepID=UPI00384EA39E
MKSPNLKTPANTCDAHIHIIDPRFAPADPSTPVAHGQSMADYRNVQTRLGLRRAVIVQAKYYATDNRCTLDAIAQMNGQARGIAVVDTSVTEQELIRLHEGGIRGLRFSLWNAGNQVVSVDMIKPLAVRIAEFGWHAQIHMGAEQILDQQTLLANLPVPLVFDHMGRLPAGANVSHPAFRFIARLIDADKAWVKLSGPYLNTVEGGPRYEDVRSLAQDFATLAPQRMVWGSDWPHVTEAHKPDDADLLDLLLDWTGSDAARQAILADNPAQLYGFED